MPSRRAKAYRAREIRRLIQEFKAQGCAACPETEPCCLTAHHRDPASKRFNLSAAALIRSRIPLATIREELAKTVCLCMNDHQKLHAGIIECPS